MLDLEVAYASLTTQKILSVKLPHGASVRDAIEACGILDEFPEIDLGINTVGIFSQRVSLDDLVKAGDRIEIYRALICDPKERRRQNVK